MSRDCSRKTKHPNDLLGLPSDQRVIQCINICLVIHTQSEAPNFRSQQARDVAIGSPLTLTRALKQVTRKPLRINTGTVPYQPACILIFACHARVV